MSEWLIHKFKCPNCGEVTRADRIIDCFKCGSEMGKIKRVGSVHDSE